MTDDDRTQLKSLVDPPCLGAKVTSRDVMAITAALAQIDDLEKSRDVLKHEVNVLVEQRSVRDTAINRLRVELHEMSAKLARAVERVPMDRDKIDELRCRPTTDEWNTVWSKLRDVSCVLRVAKEEILMLRGGREDVVARIDRVLDGTDHA